MIRKALNEFISPRAWAHDRSASIGSSEIGGCARRIKYTKSRNYEPDPTHVASWGATERGNLFERHLWEPALRKAFGKKLLYAGAKQKTFISDHLSATPDGLLIDQPTDALAHLGVPDLGPGRCFMVECKTIDPRANLPGPKHIHVMQTQVQMGLVREHTKHKPDYALLSYANASILDDVKEFVIKFDPAIFANAKVRAKQIIDTDDPKDLRPEGWIAGGKECEYCPFVAQCGIARHNLPSAKYAKPVVELQFVAEMTDMVRAAKIAQENVTAAQEDFKRHQDSIKERLKDKGLRKIPGVVDWIEVKARTTYDNDAIRKFAVARGLNLSEHSTVGEPSDRLVLGDVAPDL